MDLKLQVRELCKQKNAIILCHTYQPSDVQDLADVVGDSYGLSVRASRLDSDLIVFCGVRFMAETAAILNPGRRVLLPNPSAGCPMADMITAEELRKLKLEHPGAIPVCYVNSTAEVKAECDLCVTSSNAVQVISRLPADRPILFVPDQFLGRFVQKQLNRKFIFWNGCCPVHNRLTTQMILDAKKIYPQAEVMVHPECTPEIQALADHVLSTGQMIELVREVEPREYIVGTELGICHPLRMASPESFFHELDPCLICDDMKRITPGLVLKCLYEENPVVTVSREIADKSRKAIMKMIEYSS